MFFFQDLVMENLENNISCLSEGSLPQKVFLKNTQLFSLVAITHS